MRQPGCGPRRVGGLSASVALHAALLGGVLVLPVLTPSVLPEPAASPTPRVPVFALVPPPAPIGKPIFDRARGASSPSKMKGMAAPRQEARPPQPTDDGPGGPTPDLPADGGCTGCSFGGEGDGVLGGGSDPAPSPGPGDSPFRVGGQVLPPQKRHHVAPLYPEIARAAHVQGVVVLECVIGRNGRVSDIRVLRGQPLLEGAALDAVRQWIYSPSRLNGHPIAVIMTVTVDFRLPP